MRKNRYDLIEELFGIRCEVSALNDEQLEIYLKKVIERKRERDREKKRKEYKRKSFKQHQRSKLSYERNRKKAIERIARNKDKQRPERIINRSIKHFESQRISTRDLSNAVNGAVELCIAAFNKSFYGENNK
jgi:hypothetical protein